MKRVEIVCDGCGDVSRTDEYIVRIAKAFDTTTGAIHEQLWDGMVIEGVPVSVSGATVRRAYAPPDDPAA